jgi:hypothetical protein
VLVSNGTFVANELDAQSVVCVWNVSHDDRKEYERNSALYYEQEFPEFGTYVEVLQSSFVSFLSSSYSD